ncbi:hypothetical protein Q9Q99_10560 [Curtobacterium flaccumfaciens]|nr:hypothetical protein Q9Q99_10560 [Curtobacterium flaccumfaciens]
MIDGLAALRDEYQDFEGQLLLDALFRVYAEGPALGISFAVSTTRAKAVPSAMDEVTTQKWMFRLADPYDYASIGVRPKDVPPPVPGRFIDSILRLQSHVATPDVPLAQAVDRPRRALARHGSEGECGRSAARRRPGRRTRYGCGVRGGTVADPDRGRRGRSPSRSARGLRRRTRARCGSSPVGQVDRAPGARGPRSRRGWRATGGLGDL